MMREIKFRAWDRRRKMMLTENMNSPRYVGFGGGVIMIGEGMECFGGYPQVKSEEKLEIMQFTGIKDKNDVDMYRKDLVYSTELLALESKNIFSIEWDDEHGAFKAKEIGSDYWCYLDDFTWEIIGNTYENPELEK